MSGEFWKLLNKIQLAAKTRLNWLLKKEMEMDKEAKYQTELLEQEIECGEGL